MTEVAFAPPAREIELPLPVVLMWKILVEPYRPPSQRASGIMLPEEAVANAKILTIVGQIRAMGEQAYLSPKLADRNNPVVGDWVVYGRYAGQQITMADGREFRVLNDDDIIARVSDPSLLRLPL
jgi:co-chaperonin GroES (HSP10)